jgi:hypothetical protein
MSLFRIASIALTVAIVVGVMMNYPDIKRYLKIEQM